MLEAYEYILRSLCKAGLPEGNIFDYTASKLIKFETKWKTEQKKKAIVQKYQLLGTGKKDEDILPPIKTPKTAVQGQKKQPVGNEKARAGSKLYFCQKHNLSGAIQSRSESPKKGTQPSAKTKEDPKKPGDKKDAQATSAKNQAQAPQSNPNTSAKGKSQAPVQPQTTGKSAQPAKGQEVPNPPIAAKTPKTVPKPK